MAGDFAATPEPPYYAVIFSSQRTEGDDGYEAEARALTELALREPGCLGVESARGPDGFGITAAYFTDEDALRRWRENARHKAAQQRGREAWYARYSVRVAKVERAYFGHDQN